MSIQNTYNSSKQLWKEANLWTLKWRMYNPAYISLIVCNVKESSTGWFIWCLAPYSLFMWLIEGLVFRADTKILFQKIALNKLYSISWNEHLSDMMLYFFPILFKEKSNLVSPVALGLCRNTVQGWASHKFKAILRFQSRTLMGCILNTLWKKQIFYSKVTISSFKHVQVSILL